MANARAEIVTILERVLKEDGYASLLMRHSLREFEERDRKFVSEVVYGTLRNLSLLEAQWKSYAKKTKLRTAVVLDMTIYQMFFMETEDYAAVNEAVNLVSSHEKGFVNAILHKVQKAGLKTKEGNSLEDVALLTSHPLWLLQMWKAHYGEETAIQIAKADQERPTIFGRMNALKISKEELEKEKAVHFVNEISFTYDGLLQTSDYFKNGQVLIQDVHSALVPTLLDVKAGMTVLDACAAPGTKTQEIAMFMEDKGCIEAGDLYEHRTDLMKELMNRTGVSIVHPIVRDATKKEPYKDETFDRILLDVPCSGLGDLSHKPEIRYHIKPESLDEIINIQKQILEVNAPLLKKGGIFVYSTCTLNRKENEGQIKNFLKDHEGYELLEEKTLFPFEDGGDGFYYAKVRKNL